MINAFHKLDTFLAFNYSLIFVFLGTSCLLRKLVFNGDEESITTLLPSFVSVLLMGVSFRWLSYYN